MAFAYEKDANGIVSVTMDMDGPVNAMNDAFLPQFLEAVDRIEAEEDLKGVIWTSAKETFFAGGDLNMLKSITPDGVEALFESVEGTKAVMRRLEKLPVPIVAAINGAALGGGYEICLACNYRIASENPKTKIGLPEVTLGLLPGGGGTVRLTWLLGLEAAMPFLLEGRQVSPSKALATGLVHEVVAPDQLLERAREYILSVQGNETAAVQPWDTKGYKIPGGPSNSPKNAPRIAGATAMLFKKTKGLMPAPTRILDIMTEAAGRIDFDTAQRYESRRFASLTPLAPTKNMIETLFFGMNKVNGGASRPKDIPRSKVQRLGILGAGMMGQGITYSAAMAGIPVVLKDTTLTAAERGKAYTEKLLTKRVEKGRMTTEQRDAVLALITPTNKAEDIKGCDLIIEAVFEKIDVKNAVLSEHEELLAEGGFWGSNTSTLPITRLAEKSAKPANFVGLHFFSPVDKMPLLEIIAGDETSDETLARAFDFARQIKKTPIIVGDKTGFYTSRTIGTKMLEAAQLVAEGQDPLRVDNLSRLTGMPTGMLSLLDEVQLKLVDDIYNTQVQMGLQDPADEATPEARKLVHDLITEHDRLGRATGKGFYEYTADGKAIWSGLAAWRKEGSDLPDQDIQDRIMFRAILETLRCLEEGVLRSVADGNVGSILGIGAPVHTGGYIQFVNTYGLDSFVSRCDELAKLYGDRFAPPEILKNHAADQIAFR
ncbi:3-hydroxyacyl-CoA dehydrogenase NAD-binding domain-containing protein [Ruegeria sp. Ofav3-42]|uniref:3-hydroxyacyl-CoA dehydrogenase NAD-binding domain-containing protein n=1 Tax=Ruegeria sp. Ofav3-42 TaxID=2917759 RepID=UPI001EF6FC82|nr:3-hydroxyacyl-CoA dehydrogenase NAD-binding domain-containing protein [Ruegeria sp. Ofav3-42]MCG7521833.1 3-hydroxyacyl-CoA dehydrogenase NAD-binding domain-containing protein [Ruegeria sp. Ofav3-42]